MTNQSSAEVLERINHARRGAHKHRRRTRPRPRRVLHRERQKGVTVVSLLALWGAIRVETRTSRFSVVGRDAGRRPLFKRREQERARRRRGDTRGEVPHLGSSRGERQRRARALQRLRRGGEKSHVMCGVLLSPIRTPNRPRPPPHPRPRRGEGGGFRAEGCQPRRRRQEARYFSTRDFYHVHTRSV